MVGTRVQVGATALAFVASLMSSAVVRAQEFTCTEFIGYSQTMQWYFGGAQAELGRGRSQLRWQGGATIDNWAEPGFAGWSPGSRVNGCSQGEDRPDRVVMDITGEFHDDVSWWVGEINTVLNIIRNRYPSAAQIVLQPVVGGPNGSRCQIGGSDVRASFNHPFVWEAINRVAGGTVVAGVKPTVRSCGDYADTLGHLTDQAKGPIGASIGQLYASGQIASPVAPPPPPEEPAPPALAPQPVSDAFCPPGMVPDFSAGFAILKATLGDAMGAAMSCEFGDPLGTGDVLQETSAGLAFYRVSTNTPTFTDGWNHWGLTTDGIVYWTGGSIDPPQ
jgi:hypothetical protein